MCTTNTVRQQRSALISTRTKRLKFNLLSLEELLSTNIGENCQRLGRLPYLIADDDTETEKSCA